MVGPKNSATPLTTWLITIIDQSFPTRYYSTLFLKVLQNCKLSKFEFLVFYTNMTFFWTLNFDGL